MTELPALIQPAMIAQACSCSRRHMISLLRGAGILERLGAHWYVDEARLRERFPGVHERVYAYFVLRPEMEAAERSKRASR